MNSKQTILYVFEAIQWALVGGLLGLTLRPVFRRRGSDHRRAERRDQ